ncbi:MAG: hypothetical protein AAB869_03760, partial [Patescibacteria group bacterium]
GEWHHASSRLLWFEDACGPEVAPVIVFRVQNVIKPAACPYPAAGLRLNSTEVSRQSVRHAA